MKLVQVAGLITIVSACFFVAGRSQVPNNALMNAPPVRLAIHTTRIILVGDSTVAPQTGWGGLFCGLHVKEDVACLNLARGGRSTRTYQTDGLWSLVKDELKVPGYQANFVLIQMGHNDKSLDPIIGTELKKEFPGNLRLFVEEARTLGATPILLTPLATRHFKSYRINNTLLPWAEQVEKIGEELNVPILNLNKQSAALFQRLGATGSAAFSAVAPTESERKAAEDGTTLAPRLPKSTPITAETPVDDPRRKFTQDYTHLNAAGAEAVSALVASGLAVASPELRSHLVP